METLLVGLSIGIVGSLIATAIWTYFGQPIIISLSYGYPPVAGRYIAIYPDHPDWGAEPVRVRQMGSRISGEFKDPETHERYEFVGNVTSSRIVTYQFTPQNKKLNDYGVGLVRLDREGEGGSGFVLFLSDEDEMPAVVKINVYSERKAVQMGSA